jgi:hypothetical protein
MKIFQLKIVRRYDKKNRFVVLVYILFCLLLLFGNLGLISKFIFTIISVGLGFAFFFRSTELYISFTLWLWFLAPFVYRVIEYRIGDSTPGHCLAPAIVGLISCIQLPKLLLNKLNFRAFPFILCALCFIYGSLIGVIHGIFDFSSTLMMISPIIFGCYLCIDWRNYPKNIKTIKTTFFWGIFILAVYGIMQKIFFFPWDQHFFNNTRASEVSTMDGSLITGAFSTTNGRQQFGAYLIAGIVLLLANQISQKIKISNVCMLVVEHIALLLTSARACWLGWIVSLLFFLVTFKSSRNLKLVSFLLLLAILMFSLISVEPFSSMIMGRLNSFSNLSEDYSLNERQKAYDILFEKSLTEFVGLGIGTDIFALNGHAGSFDGSIFQMLLWTGWIGVGMLISGLALIYWELFANKVNNDYESVYATRSISLGILVQAGFNLIFIGEHALILWSFLGISMAGLIYNRKFSKSPGRAINNTLC